MLLLAHRGYHADVPENTLESFKAAFEIGLDGIETDVRLSGDGMLVLIHDRVTSQQQSVSELSKRELERAYGHVIPTLEQALTQWPQLFWNIEIKTSAALLPTIKILKQYQNSHNLLVTSFRHDIIVQVAKEVDVDCGLLLAHRPLDLPVLVSQVLALPRLRTIVWDYNILDEAMINHAVQIGFNNMVYGVITKKEHMHCKNLDLKGLITDYPEQILPAK